MWPDQTDWNNAGIQFISLRNPRRQKKQVFFGYSPPLSVDSVYFFVRFLDKNRHSPPISEFIPQIIGGLRPRIMTGDNSEIGGECLLLMKNPPQNIHHCAVKQVFSEK